MSQSIRIRGVIDAALFSWTEGAAHGLVDHGCENGLEAWRSYNRYIPASEGLRNLSIGVCDVHTSC